MFSPMDSVVVYYVYINNRIKPGMWCTPFILAETRVQSQPGQGVVSSSTAKVKYRETLSQNKQTKNNSNNSSAIK